MRGKLDTAPGIVTSVDKTTFSTGRYHKIGITADTPIYAYHYKFETGRASCQGTCYGTSERYQAGSKVTVEFPPDRPDRSRIQGMRRAIFGPSVGLIFLFPAVGVVFILPFARRGSWNIRLLAHGGAARATLIRQEPVKKRMDYSTIYRFIFQFSDAKGQIHETMITTSSPEERLLTDPIQWVFYDPNKPARSILLYSLPGQQGLTDQGNIRPCDPRSALVATLLALFAFAVVGIGLWLEF